MATSTNKVKVIEQSKVSPPLGSVLATSVPLTLFDIPWLFCPHIQRLYFYEFPHPTHHFLENILPTLKHSLSLTLQHFFPFAANLFFPPPPEKPHILFTEGGSSVSLTVAESDADFDSLSANHPRPVQEFYPFVPTLADTFAEGDTRVSPILALQVTVFPNSGICIGVAFHHVAADGRAFHHFMKSWALVCKTKGDLTRLESELGFPSHDRAAIKDPDGLELAFLKLCWSVASTRDDQKVGPALDFRADNVRATLVVRQVHIHMLKHWVTNQLATDENSKSFHISSFVVTCALIWVCLAKSEEVREKNSTTNQDDEPYYFSFLADVRSRLLEYPLETYFGNCLIGFFVPLKRKELLGENGTAAAAKAIGKQVAGLDKVALKDLSQWIVKFKEVTERWQHLVVAGSPKLGVYEADFGWGRPKKSESAHFEDSSAISLAESRDESGGIEVGLVLSKDRMSRFSGILEEILMKLV